MEKNYWNYRVMKKIEPFGETYYGIHEVHYKNDIPILYSESVEIGEYIETWEDDSSGIESLRTTLTNMLKALDKPILTDEDFHKGE